MGHIVDKFTAELAANLAEKKVFLTLTPAARAVLAKAGYDPVFGARPLARVLCAKVEDPLAGEVLFGRLIRGGRVTVKASRNREGGEADLAFHYAPAASGVKKRK
jgi:ATP-dependent Clp protease ATP-binding subunit ClpA